MEFEIINEKGNTVMNTPHKSCIPEKSQIEQMAKLGYKFKCNGKVIKKTKVLEIQSEVDYAADSKI